MIVLVAQAAGDGVRSKDQAGRWALVVWRPHSGLRFAKASFGPH